MKEIADALADEIIRLRGTTKNVDAVRREMAGGIGSATDRYAVDNKRRPRRVGTIPLSNKGEVGSVVDVGRRRRMRRVLRDNSPIPFHHIFRNNYGCCISLRV
jgi:hypothetical protein